MSCSALPRSFALVLAAVACSSGHSRTGASGGGVGGTAGGVGVGGWGNGGTEASASGGGGAGNGGSDASAPGGAAGNGGSTVAGNGGSSAAGGTSGCGVCPTGYACGLANGLAVCRSAAGIPLFTHVVVIAMEDTSLATLDSSTNTPYLHSLEGLGVLGTDYHGVGHPSLPNYLALTIGDTGGVSCNCWPTGAVCSVTNCNAIQQSCGCPVSAPSFVDQLEARGDAWMAYGEDMASPCNTTASGSYDPRHVPFLYLTALQADNVRCTAHVRDFSEFPTNPGSDLARYVYIAPNLTHDMHDPIPAGAANLANGDGWLSAYLPPILASDAYTSGSLVVVVWDEADGSPTAPDDPVPVFLLSPYAKRNVRSATVANHFSLLATIEDGLAVSRTGSAATAAPLTDSFPAN